MERDESIIAQAMMLSLVIKDWCYLLFQVK